MPKATQLDGDKTRVSDPNACGPLCLAPRIGLPSPHVLCLPSPDREAVEQMISSTPAGFHAPMARDGYLQDPDEAETGPPGPGRPPHPRGTKTAASHQSSLTSLEGSGISEHLPQKSLHHAGGPHLEVSIHMGRDFCPWAFAHTLPECRLFPISARHNSAPAFRARARCCLSAAAPWPPLPLPGALAL